MTPERLAFLAAIVADRCDPDIRADLMELVRYVERDLGVPVDIAALRSRRITGEGRMVIRVPAAGLPRPEKEAQTWP